MALQIDPGTVLETRPSYRHTFLRARRHGFICQFRPGTDAGTRVIYGDNSPLSDLIYTSDLTIESAPPQLGWRMLLFSGLPLLLFMALWISQSPADR